jgi:uncharacterized membrane protein YeaQ/YmgE (transglycosylase-associated protein family)
MYLSNQSLLVIVVVGIVAGWLAGKVVEGGGFGLIWDLVVGLIGAFISDWLLPRLGIHLARKMHRLGRISPKVLIFRAIKIAIQINTVFAEPHRPWLVTCFSWVPITCPRHGRFNCERSSRKSNC